MNILFITQLFPYDKEAKNTSGILREFIEEWGKTSHKIQVIRPHFNYEKEQFPDHKKFVIGKNISVEFIRPVRIPVLKLSFYWNNRLINKLDFKPDVIICELYNSYLPFSKIAKKLNIPLIVGLHMSDIRISKYWVYKWFQNRVLRNAEVIACHSHSIYNMAIKTFPHLKESINLFPLGIPQSIINESKNIKENKVKEAVEIVSVCKLIQLKHIDRVIKALNMLPSSINWRYTIIGDGPKRAELESLSRELGISKKINFLGYLRRKEIAPQLLNKEVFILPSYPETFGLVYLEAMSCGNIVIGTKGWGIDGVIIDGKNGFLCDATNIDTIKSKLMDVISLSTQEKHTIIKNSIQTVASFSVERKASEFLRKIEDCCKIQK